MYKMVNYGNGKIYKVICSETGRIYIGSTTSPLSKRMTQHRCKSGNKCMTNDFIDGKIFLIEDYPCERKEQLLMRERFHIESMQCVNKFIPTRTRKEYLQFNKEYTKQKLKEYQEKNKEQIKQKSKEYREKNKDQINQKHKEYREKNNEVLKEKAHQKFDCECGGKYQRSTKARHIKSNKHQAYLSSIV